MSNAITSARRRTALLLRGIELPAAFQDATLEAACLAYERNASPKTRRRLVGKVVRIAEVAR